jgi:hypothetical protein
MKKLVVPVLLVAVFASMMIPAGFAWQTPGFWKNKGYKDYGPYADDIWGTMAMADGTPLDGALAYEVLWMDKSTGDATKILAFQLIAAILNVEVLGSYVYPCMQEVIDGGFAALAAAGGIGADPEPGPLRDDCIYYAELLDLMNNDMFL